MIYYFKGKKILNIEDIKAEIIKCLKPLHKPMLSSHQYSLVQKP